MIILNYPISIHHVGSAVTSCRVVCGVAGSARRWRLLPAVEAASAVPPRPAAPAVVVLSVPAPCRVGRVGASLAATPCGRSRQRRAAASCCACCAGAVTAQNRRNSSCAVEFPIRTTESTCLQRRCSKYPSCSAGAHTCARTPMRTSKTTRFVNCAVIV